MADLSNNTEKRSMISEFNDSKSSPLDRLNSRKLGENSLVIRGSSDSLNDGPSPSVSNHSPNYSNISQNDAELSNAHHNNGIGDVLDQEKYDMPTSDIPDAQTTDYNINELRECPSMRSTPNSSKSISGSQSTELVKDMLYSQYSLKVLSASDLELHKNKPSSKAQCGNDHLRHSDSEIKTASRFSMSDLSLSSEDEDYCEQYNCLEQIKQIQFLLSSSISSLSDDQDSVSRLDELPENLSYESIVTSDTEFYHDWESGSNFGNDNSQSHGNPSLETNELDLELERIREEDIPFPHRAQHFVECDICLSVSYIRRRVCCDYQICNACLSTYITLKVKDGKVQMECPNDRCNASVFKDEIHYRLSTDMRAKFAKFLINANADPHVKTCPSCSQPYEIDPELLNVNKRKLKYGLKVVCGHCKLAWCFPCHAPFHSPLSCKKYKKEDEIVKRWAKQKKDGQTNAQKCPKCKIYIQKKDGCDHMQCSHCNTDFCYRCGDRYISIKLLGNHWSRFSLFGCRYRLLPEKPALRRLIRGTNFGARLVAAVVLAGLGVAAGAVLLGASVFILPGYGILHLRRNLWARKQRKKFLKQKRLMLAAAQREREKPACREVIFLDSIPEESETETSNPTSDPQQIQVLVHRSVSFNKEEAEDRSKDCDILVNKYISDGTEVVVSKVVDENETSSRGTKDDEVVMLTDVQEIKNENGYSTVVCNIVSTVNDPSSSESDGKTTELMNKDESFEIPDAAVGVCNSNLSSNIVDNNPEDNFPENPNTADTKPESISGTIPSLNDSHEEFTPIATSEISLERKKKKAGTSYSHDSEVDETLYQVDKKIFRELEEKLKVKEDKLKEREEKLKEREEKLKEKEEKLKEKETISIVSKLKNNQDKLIMSEEVVDKVANNGCFGNIFSSSKRAGNSSPGNQETLKNDNNPPKTAKTKDLINAKAATWEKCRRTHIVDTENPGSKTSLDLTADIKHLPYYLQKSPSSLSSIISFSYGGGEEESKSSKTGEPLIPLIKSTETLSESSSRKGSEECQQQADYDASIESGYVSKYNLVTYL